MMVQLNTNEDLVKQNDKFEINKVKKGSRHVLEDDITKTVPTISKKKKGKGEINVARNSKK